MTMEELFELPPVFDIRTLARALGLGRDKVYRYAAEKGQIPGDPPIPIRRYGSEWRATRPDLFRHLGLDPAAVAVPVELPLAA
jgi:hypothetical protein